MLSLRVLPDQHSPTPPAPKQDGGVTHCTTERLSSMDCESVSTWKVRATAACMATTRVIARLELRDFCMQPPDASKSAVVDCCKVATRPPCMMRTQGDGTRCRDQNTWLMSAQLDCGSHGRRVADLALKDPCSMGTERYRFIKYLCCSSTPLQPGDRLPNVGAGGDDNLETPRGGVP